MEYIRALRKQFSIILSTVVLFNKTVYIKYFDIKISLSLSSNDLFTWELSLLDFKFFFFEKNALENIIIFLRLFHKINIHIYYIYPPEYKREKEWLYNVYVVGDVRVFVFHRVFFLNTTVHCNWIVHNDLKWFNNDYSLWYYINGSRCWTIHCLRRHMHNTIYFSTLF